MSFIAILSNVEPCIYLIRNNIDPYIFCILLNLPFLKTSEVGSADSTDNSEISGKSDSRPLNDNTAKLSGSCPDIGATCRRSRADSKTVDRKTKKEKRTLHCCYCGKACERMELHLMHDHPKEPKVIEALHFSNTLEERKRLLSLLYSNKKLKPHYTTRNKKDEDLVHCIFCQGYYQRNQFWKHALICEQKQPKEYILTEPGSSTHLPNTSLQARPRVAQKTFDPESGNLLKGVFCNTVQETTQESVNLPSPKAERHTTHYLYSISPVSEAGNTARNPIPDHGSESLSILYAGKSSALMNLDSNSSGPLILNSLHSALEYTHSLVQESCPSTVQDSLVRNKKLACPPIKTKGISEIPDIPVLSSSYLLDTGSNSPQQNAEQACKSSITQAVECNGKHGTPQQSVSHTHTGSSDSQPATNLKSDWTTMPTTVSVDLEENRGPDTGPERTGITMPEHRAARTAKSNPRSESTSCLAANFFSSNAQKIANPGTGNVSIQVLGNGNRRAPDVESHCRLIPIRVPNEEPQIANPETSSAAKKQFESEGHVRDFTAVGDKGTAQNSDLKPLGLNSTTTVKRKLDCWSRDTKRRRQSEPLQVHLLC